jgi:hypothetical protein
MRLIGLAVVLALLTLSKRGNVDIQIRVTRRRNEDLMPLDNNRNYGEVRPCN